MLLFLCWVNASVLHFSSRLDASRLMRAVVQMSLLQASRPSVWQPFIEIEPSFGPISSIATPPWYQASFPRTAELLRHMLFVGCKESVLAYHVASPATRVLCTSMPPHVTQGSILRVDTWQHCLSFPEDKDTVLRTKHDTTSLDFKRDISHGVWADGHASEFCKDELREENVKVCWDDQSEQNGLYLSSLLSVQVFFFFSFFLFFFFFFFFIFCLRFDTLNSCVPYY